MKRVEKILEVLRNSVAQFQDNDSKKGVMLNFLFQDVLLLQIFKNQQQFNTAMLGQMT